MGILCKDGLFSRGLDASATEIRHYPRRDGKAVAGNRRPFGWPVILEVLERIEFDFDYNGEPELPSIIGDRTSAR